MKDISKELAEELLTTLQSTKEFVLEQAPDVVQQVLAWAVWSSGLGIVAGLGLIAGSLYLFKLAKRWYNEDKGSFKDSEVIPFVFGLVCAVWGVTAACLNVATLTKALVAPKLYLIEYLGGLVK